MIISQDVFERMKEEHIVNGVFLLVSNNRQSLREEAAAFAHSLLNYTQQDVMLNERVFVTEGDYIPAEMANQFIEFEQKQAVGVPAKILILHDVELCKDAVSDKLLKCIEDHHRDSLIIFTSTALEAVSRTIRSRCMIFKEYTEVDDYFIQFRNKYLSFIEKVDVDDYLKLPEIVEEMQNLGALNVIQAMFVNLTDTTALEIATRALKIRSSGAKDSQVFQYLVYSFWCKNHALRTWTGGDVSCR